MRSINEKEASKSIDNFLEGVWNFSKDAIKVTALALVVTAAVFIGRAAYQPKKVNYYGDFLSIDEKHMLGFDPNLSIWDPNSKMYLRKVYTIERYNEMMKK